MKNLTRIAFVVILFTFLYLKDVESLFVCLLLLVLVSYKEFLSLNTRVVKSILLFNLSVSVGYFVMSLIQTLSPWEFLLYINLKVYLLTYFVFYFFSKVDMIAFFSFSKELSFLLSISLSQIISYKKTFDDFRLAFQARVIRKVSEREKGFITQVLEFFLLKALRDSKERTMAMKARGFFDNSYKS
jgi:cobalt/nickel transport system permease protein